MGRSASWWFAEAVRLALVVGTVVIFWTGLA